MGSRLTEGNSGRMQEEKDEQVIEV